MTYFSTKRGYTLLFAVLTAALVLGVAVFILSVSRKQYILSATARDSLYSFYAADSGIECLTMVDDVFSTDPYQVNCNGSLTDVTFGAAAPAEIPSDADKNANPAPQAAHFNLGFKEGTNVFGCAKMTILNYLVKGRTVIIIRSRGYNLCTASNEPDTSQRTVERALELRID